MLRAILVGIVTYVVLAFVIAMIGGVGPYEAMLIALPAILVGIYAYLRGTPNR